jgi:hypothetical protein
MMKKIYIFHCTTAQLFREIEEREALQHKCPEGQALVGTLLLKSSGVTLLPLLVKELATFNPLLIFSATVP